MGIQVDPPPTDPKWSFQWANWLSRVLYQKVKNGPFFLDSYAVSDMPDATLYAGAIIYVSDETGGAVLAFSDGTNWRRSTDRTIVS